MTDSSSSSWPDLPGYTLLDLAGTGGMSIVFRALETATNRPVAVKILTPRVGDEANLPRFEREAQIIASLEHPHILPLYRFGIHDGQPFMITRFMEGGSVADRLQQGAIPIEQAVRWTIGIAEALDLAHERGILHRDIKPSNMLLDQSGHVYLADFGLADRGDETALIKGGSAPYMSPEQCRREENLSAASDVYSLAVSLYEMVTGEKPFVAESPLAVQIKHIEAPIPSAQAANPEISVALDDAINWGMAKQAHDRPPRGAAFAAALRLALTNPDQKIHWRTFIEEDLALRESEPESNRPADERTAAVRPRRLSAGWLLLILLPLLGLAVVLFLLTTRPTATVPTPIPGGAVLELPQTEPTPAGRIYFDDFGENSTAGDESDEARLVDEALELATDDPRFRIFWPADMPARADVKIETDVRPLNLPERFELGLLCRFVDPQNFTGVVWVVDEAVRLMVWSVLEGEISIIAEIVAADTDLTELENGGKWGLTCDGDRLAAAFNGRELLTAAGLAVGEPGAAALMIRPLDETELTIHYDNFTVREP